VLQLIEELPASADAISIHGAREHNLKNISLEIPRNQFVVTTGVSGSGKSTLAFDLLFAEGERRFLDSMNVYLYALCSTLRWALVKGSFFISAGVFQPAAQTPTVVPTSSLTPGLPGL
jgi:type II secretory pathway predicted ATPase ExeA